MRLYQVDAFTSRPFSGNPAGVWVGDIFPDKDRMQAIAAEMNLSETAFVELGREKISIRFYTPTCEVPLCGHATIASMHVLHELGHVKDGIPITLHAATRELPVSFQSGRVEMTFPTYSLSAMENISQVRQMVGVPVKEAYLSENRWIVARVTDEKALAEVQPDFATIRESEIGLVTVTTEGSGAEHDYLVRVFCNPLYGIGEDPVTGAAQCVLAPFWHKRLRKNVFQSRQVSSRGGEMGVKFSADAVRIQGQAVTVFTIEMNI